MPPFGTLAMLIRRGALRNGHASQEWWNGSGRAMLICQYG
jgi:hypothetical protein